MIDFWLDLFSPDTWEDARQYHFQVTGFRSSRWKTVNKINKGDLFICYLTKVSRFCGILKAVSEPYYDENKAKKIWKYDSFPCLIDVEPIITFDIIRSLPKEEIIPNLGNPFSWGGYIRSSPHLIPDSDGEYIMKSLEKQKQDMRLYPIKGKKRKPEKK